MKLSFVAPGFSQARVQRQPWAYVDRVARGLVDRGFDLRILTNCSVPDRETLSTPYLVKTCPGITGLRTWVQGPPTTIFDSVDSSDVLVAFLAWPNVSAWPSPPGKCLQVVAVTSPLFGNGEWRNLLRGPDDAMGRIQLLLSQFCARGLHTEDFEGFDGVVAAEATTHSFLSSRLNRVPLLLAPSGVDGDVVGFAPGDRTRNQGDSVLTYCGPPRRSRGLHVFLEALAILQHELPKLRARLLFRPDSPHDQMQAQEAIRRVSTLPDPDRVSVELAPLPRGEFLRAIADSTVCSFPFQYPVSLTPITLLETLAMGVPSVVTPVGELPHLIGDDQGLIAAGSGPKENAAALRRVLGRPPNQTQTLNGQRPLTWDEVSGRWADFLDSLA